MKKLLILFLALAMLLPAAVLADPAEPSEKYSTFGATADIGNIFPGKYFSMDVFMAYDLSAYVIVTTWDEHDVSTMTKLAHIRTKKGYDGQFLLVFADDSYYTFRYADENQTAIWLDIDSVSIKLNYSQWLVPVTDVKQ